MEVTKFYILGKVFNFLINQAKIKAHIKLPYKRNRRVKRYGKIYVEKRNKIHFLCIQDYSQKIILEKKLLINLGMIEACINMPYKRNWRVKR